MAEMTLHTYIFERGMKAASCRYFTVYGERGREDHAVMAMIARVHQAGPVRRLGQQPADQELDICG